MPRSKSARSLSVDHSKSKKRQRQQSSPAEKNIPSAGGAMSSSTSQHPTTTASSATACPFSASSNTSSTSVCNELSKVLFGDGPGCSCCFPNIRCNEKPREACRGILNNSRYIATSRLQEARKRQRELGEEVARKRLKTPTKNSTEEAAQSTTPKTYTARHSITTSTFTQGRSLCETCNNILTAHEPDFRFEACEHSGQKQSNSSKECHKCKRKRAFAIKHQPRFYAMNFDRLTSSDLREAWLKFMENKLDNPSDMSPSSPSMSPPSRSNNDFSDIAPNMTDSSNHCVVLSDGGGSSDSDCCILEGAPVMAKVSFKREILDASTCGETSEEEEKGTCRLVDVGREEVMVNNSCHEDKKREKETGQNLNTSLTVSNEHRDVPGPEASEQTVPRSQENTASAVREQARPPVQDTNGSSHDEARPTVQDDIESGHDEARLSAQNTNESGHNEARPTVHDAIESEHDEARSTVQDAIELGHDETLQATQKAAEEDAAWLNSLDVGLEGWRVENRDPGAQYLYMLLNQLFCDCTLTLHDEENTQTTFKCHKAILARASHIFEQLLFGEDAKSDVQLPHLQPAAFQHLLTFIYGGQFEVRELKDALAVCDLAREYQLPELSKKCFQVILLKVTPCNVCLLMQYARDNNIQHLNNSCLKVWRSRTAEVLSSEGFLSCDQEVLTQMLEEPRLNIESELELVTAYERWLTTRVTGNQVDLYAPGRQHLRFLALSLLQFAEGPAKSNVLLTQEEKLAIFMALASPVQVNLPNNLSNEKTSRSLPRVK